MVNLIELANQLKNMPTTTNKKPTPKPTPKPKEWYENDSDKYSLQRRTAKLLEQGTIDEDTKIRTDTIGTRIAWDRLDVKNTIKGYFDQLDNDPDYYINTNNKTVNGILAAALKPDAKTTTEAIYKTALSIIAQQNIRALKALHVYSLKPNELTRLAKQAPDGYHMILLTNEKGELRLQDLYSLTIDQNYKLMPTWTWRHNLDDGNHERTLTVCREEIINYKTVEYSYRQYRLAELNKTNGETTITYPTRLKTQQDNPRYEHCYYLN